MSLEPFVHACMSLHKAVVDDFQVNLEPHDGLSVFIVCCHSLWGLRSLSICRLLLLTHVHGLLLTHRLILLAHVLWWLLAHRRCHWRLLLSIHSIELALGQKGLINELIRKVIGLCKLLARIRVNLKGLLILLSRRHSLSHHHLLHILWIHVLTHHLLLLLLAAHLRVGSLLFDPGNDALYEMDLVKIGRQSIHGEVRHKYVNISNLAADIAVF